ncbi:glycosyltransferase family 92 protein [Paragemmobacter straminiformis]|uniref:Glycosyltransferase family 92 protein n=1 Tax=Paragemmobacter straminiformis TaxID=2045119 RepID=A0A842I990_9RHOB|nr:glycosyltransferase family 92 protein [Gemmobacter straminiformis]MBC2836151.1 glycosyltransferase family 92 protein [Gemmobacter straminiformis]
MLDPFGFIGRWLAARRDLQTAFAHELAVCAIFKNEARYLDEWLTFHHGVGVGHFYLYNDGSTDGFAEVLAPWIAAGKITLTDWTVKPQVPAYNDCILRRRTEARWIAFIDLDEFLFSPTGAPLPEVLRGYAEAAAVFVYWVLFGSGGHEAQPDLPVVEAYTACMGHAAALADGFDHGKVKDRSNYVTGWSRDGKSIVNPRKVRFQGVHAPRAVWSGATVDERGRPPRQRSDDCDLPYAVLRINHYWSKSLDEFRAKIVRGSIANRTRPARNLARWLEREAMLNSDRDETILPIWRRIVAARR